MLVSPGMRTVAALFSGLVVMTGDDYVVNMGCCVGLGVEAVAMSRSSAE